MENYKPKNKNEVVKRKESNIREKVLYAILVYLIVWGGADLVDDISHLAKLYWHANAPVIDTDIDIEKFFNSSSENLSVNYREFVADINSALRTYLGREFDVAIDMHEYIVMALTSHDYAVTDYYYVDFKDENGEFSNEVFNSSLERSLVYLRAEEVPLVIDYYFKSLFSNLANNLLSLEHVLLSLTVLIGFLLRNNGKRLKLNKKLAKQLQALLEVGISEDNMKEAIEILLEYRDTLLLDRSMQARIDRLRVDYANDATSVRFNTDNVREIASRISESKEAK